MLFKMQFVFDGYTMQVNHLFLKQYIRNHPNLNFRKDCFAHTWIMFDKNTSQVIAHIWKG